jgi:hypothetical protein
MSGSIAERLPRLLVMIEDFGPPYDSADPYRFARHKIKQAAWAALEGGMRAAAEILEAGEAFNRELRDTSNTGEKDV